MKKKRRKAPKQLHYENYVLRKRCRHLIEIARAYEDYMDLTIAKMSLREGGRNMKRDEVVNTELKFPLRHIRHDLSASMRGQGKRRGGMVMGAMSARTGVSLEIDLKATFGLTDSQAEDLEAMNMWEFNRYRHLREGGKCHESAAQESWDDPMEGGKDTTGCNE